MSEPVELLECPVCGEGCESLPAHAPTEDTPYLHWFDDEEGKCQCGAELYVSADGDNAWLVERDSSEGE